jgi:hypothetical protein
MCLLDMFNDWSNQWHELFWGDVPEARTVAADQSIPCRLHLERLRRTILDLSHRIARKEEQAQFLAERVRIFMRVGDQTNAWGLALEIDRQREFIAAERNELEQARKEYQHVVRHLRRMHGVRDCEGPALAACL